MVHNQIEFLGNDLHYRLFHGINHFPIRLHFLDTIDGGSLSIQCNPNQSYMRTNFGEKFAQDQSYYIIETKQHWKKEYRYDQTSISSSSYLGFHERSSIPDEFHRDLIAKSNQSTRF